MLFILFSLASIVAASPVQRDWDLNSTSWISSPPTGVDPSQLETRASLESPWSRGVNEGLGLNNKEVGYRLATDYSNEIIWQLDKPSSNNPLQDVTWRGGEEVNEYPHVEHWVNFGGEKFTSSESPYQSDESLWTSPNGYLPLRWKVIVTVVNGCPGESKIITATATDLYGMVETMTFVNGGRWEVRNPIFPFTLTITNHVYRQDTLTIQFKDWQGIKYKTGNGFIQPQVENPAVLESVTWYCYTGFLANGTLPYSPGS